MAEVMPVVAARQMRLVAGYYRCQDCGRDVERIRKIRRFRLCDSCYEQHVAPAYGSDVEESDALLQKRHIFWRWYQQMERRYPTQTHSTAPRLVTKGVPRLADSYYPLCECGRQRMTTLVQSGSSGLFGGPFARFCDVCEARRSVESIVGMADKIGPGRDDEEWLDVLYQSHRLAFDVGVLPDYWFELRRTV